MSWINRRNLVVAIVIILFLNEFTLSFFDPNPPLGQSSLFKIRVLDASVLFIGLISQYLMHAISYLRLSAKWFASFIMPSIIAIVLLDISLGLIGFGHQSDYEQENVERYPSPMDGFNGKPNVKDHNDLGFRGDFITTDQSYNIAIFGGSTTYNGSPTIIETVSNSLRDTGVNVEVFNFDLIIFYGGGNETLQYSYFDPRPGYPYNFFFRNELNPLIQSALRYSSILGTLDIISGGGISGLNQIKRTIKDPDWGNEIINNYWRDLSVAKQLTEHIATPNLCSSTSFMSITQPGNPQTEEGAYLWNLLTQSLSKFDNSWAHLDLTGLSSQVEFTDLIHVTQSSRDFLGIEISQEVLKLINKRCIY